jgi:hypothetical protein
MKKLMIYATITLTLILVIWAILKVITNKVGKDINEFYEPFRKQNNELFIGDVDFSDGNYVLYIKHKELGEFAVVNEESLKANRDSLKVKVSWANYLPGEGNRSFGVMLFKNNKLIKRKNGGLFKIFDIGNLKQASVSVKEHRLNAVKRDIQNKIDSLNKSKNIFITLQSDLPKEDKEFHFRIYFPSIAVPVTRGKDKYGYERILTINGIEYSEWHNGNDNGFDAMWSTHIEKCIKNKAGEITDFDLSISNGTLGDAYIFDVSENWGELKNADNQMLYLKDFMYYQYQAHIGANKEDAEKLLKIDYSNCISEIDRNRPKLIAKMKDLVKQSTKLNLSVEKGEVGLSNYKDSVTKSKTLYEQEYQLNWLEIVN